MSFTQAECFNEGIRQLRDHHFFKTNQRDLAKALGITTTHLSQLFQNKRRASSSLMDRIAETLAMSAEDVVKIGRSCLENKGFFPFIGKIDDLPANSEAQARRIVSLTNTAFGLSGHLLSYRPDGWDAFVAGKISAADFYNGYAEELSKIVELIASGKSGSKV